MWRNLRSSFVFHPGILPMTVKSKHIDHLTRTSEWQHFHWDMAPCPMDRFFQGGWECFPPTSLVHWKTNGRPMRHCQVGRLYIFNLKNILKPTIFRPQNAKQIQLVHFMKKNGVWLEFNMFLRNINIHEKPTGKKTTTRSGESGHLRWVLSPKESQDGIRFKV